MTLSVDWDSQESHVFSNPRADFQHFPSDWEKYLNYPGHIWVSTSGTVSSGDKGVKWVALSKKGFLVSAQAVNHRLRCNSSDKWMNALPLFHVGGLAIYARAKLSGASVEELALPKWCPHLFMEKIQKAKSTLTSLVPTQVFDLIQAGYSSPSTLRAVLVGGGSLSEKLEKKVRELNWPVIPTYAMTECSSSIALGHQLLPHIQASLSQEGLLQIASPSLFSGYLWISPKGFMWEDPKQQGVFTTEDCVKLNGDQLQFCGRIQDWIKIAGENVSIHFLQHHFENLLPLGIDAYLFPCPDLRLGYRIEAAGVKGQEKEINKAISAFNASVMPYEKIKTAHFLDSLPRNALGKVIKGALFPQ